MSNLESNVRFAELMIGNVKGTPKNCALCDKPAMTSTGFEIYDVSGPVLCADCARPIDETIADLATGKIELPEANYFGDCPRCGNNDGYLNVKGNHYFLCKEHKTCWGIGWNLFSSWKDEDESIWEENIKTLSACRVVEDWRRWMPCAPEGKLEWVTAKQAAPTSEAEQIKAADLRYTDPNTLHRLLSFAEHIIRYIRAHSPSLRPVLEGEERQLRKLADKFAPPPSITVNEGSCVLCPASPHEGGGIQWDDYRWICGGCWAELRTDRPQQKSVECPF